MAVAGGFVVSEEYVRDSVPLSVHADDEQSGIASVELLGSCDGGWHSLGTDTTEPFNKTWNLLGIADQPLKVKANVLDLAGNSEEAPEIQIIKDTVPPSPVTSIQPDGWDGPYTNDTSPGFAWSGAGDDSSGVGGYYAAIDDWTPDAGDWVLAAVNAWSVPDPLSDGNHFVALATLDKAGNVNQSDRDQSVRGCPLLSIHHRYGRSLIRRASLSPHTNFLSLPGQLERPGRPSGRGALRHSVQRRQRAVVEDLVSTHRPNQRHFSRRRWSSIQLPVHERMMPPKISRHILKWRTLSPKYAERLRYRQR